MKPGLSSYASNPEGAAKSVMALLKKAEAVVPKEYQASTPVRLGVINFNFLLTSLILPLILSLLFLSSMNYTISLVLWFDYIVIPYMCNIYMYVHMAGAGNGGFESFVLQYF